MSITIHPRYWVAEKAHNEIDKFVCDKVAEHELTYGELVSILARIIVSWCRYQIKDEREEAASK